ncbi:hypothetical protein MKK84_24440 [Methylobacterium sp. E-065]|uniref:hypothetical protein n=1 Tax=Methylobacterium sp. E-065 TaxID=2836583 RepID=UPI001FB8897D|nr:hypothetical protein [Methylobacterium sp. E-065]MCJ2020537.1 hypothetical protein [Methylobacterium sp. E-065]
MPDEVTFENVRAASQDGAEDAWLVYSDRTLMALLVPAETGWFLQFSLGRSDQEGLIFPTLAAAEIWARARVDVVI